MEQATIIRDQNVQNADMVIENEAAGDAGGELVQTIANMALVDPVDPEMPDDPENRQRRTKKQNISCQHPNYNITQMVRRVCYGAR